MNYASDTNLEKSLEKNVRELCHLIGAESVSAFSTSDGRKGVEEARRIV